MIRFKYRFCKVHMARFVNGDLAEPVRRRVARYIDECEDCYREYMQHREFAHKLERSLPTLGKPGAAKLDQIWTAVQAEMNETPARPWTREPRPRLGSRFSYALVVLAMTLALLLPMMMGYHSARATMDLPSLPQYASVSGGSSARASVIGATAQPQSRRQTPLLQNTPAPSF